MISKKYIVIGLLLAVVLIIGGIFSGIYVPRWLAGPQGKTEEVVITNRGQYRIQAYERFYQINEGLVEIDNKLLIYSVNKTENFRQLTECTGLLYQRANLVSEYNAKSKQERTTGKWQDPSLPHVLYNRDDVATLCR